MSTPQYKLQDDGRPYGQADLVGWLDEFSQSERYSSRRTQVLRELEERPFKATGLLVSSEGTYGYTVDPRLRRGLTIKATIEGTDHTVLVQMSADQTAEIEAMPVGTSLPVCFVITRWHSVDKAFVGHSAFDLPSAAEAVVEEDSAADEQPAAPADAEPAPAPVPQDKPQPASEEDPQNGTDSSADVVDLDAAPAVEATAEIVDLQAAATTEPATEIVDLDAAPAVEATAEIVDLAASSKADADGTAANLSVDLDALAAALNPLTSHEMASVIGSLCDIPAETVEDALQSFWLYHFDPVRLVDAEFDVEIPLIGSFSVAEDNGKVVIDIESTAEPSLQDIVAHSPSAENDNWISEYEKTGELPQDHRHFSAQMAVHLGGLHDLDLSDAFALVQNLLLVTRRVLTAGVRAIHWTDLGAMQPSSDGHVMKTYPAMTKRLAALAFWFTTASDDQGQAGSAQQDAQTGSEQGRREPRQPLFQRPLRKHGRQQQGKQSPQVEPSGCFKVAAIILGTIWVLGQLQGCPVFAASERSIQPQRVSQSDVVLQQDQFHVAGPEHRKSRLRSAAEDYPVSSDERTESVAGPTARPNGGS